MEQIFKYPRTQHIEGSRLQPGDEDLDAMPLSYLKGKFLVIEEKVDGANAAISFDKDGELRLQSRGHYLVGGYRELYFDLFKSWASGLQGRFQGVLGARYVMYGEWVYAKHIIFYDDLPHYFLEFDILEKSTGKFLSTECRADLLNGLPVQSVPVLKVGNIENKDDVTGLIGASNFKSVSWRESLVAAAAAEGLDMSKIEDQTDLSDQMEGLYIKVERDGEVTERYKFVRHDYLVRVLESDTHWLTRPIIPNQLASGVDIFGWQ